jgi:hypothetical protein
MTPAHSIIILLVLNTFLKGFRDAWGVHKDEKGINKWINIILDTLIYWTGQRAYDQKGAK